MKPRLRAEWVVLSEEFRILASCVVSCLVSPMRGIPSWRSLELEGWQSSRKRSIEENS